MSRIRDAKEWVRGSLVILSSPDPGEVDHGDGKQCAAARRNIKKSQVMWQSMTPRQHSRANPRTRADETRRHRRRRVLSHHRAAEGAVRDLPHSRCRRTETHSASGRQMCKWVVGHADVAGEQGRHAHREGRRLVPDTKDAKNLFAKLSTSPKHVKGDIFEAKDRLNVPEREKPTAPPTPRSRGATSRKPKRHERDTEARIVMPSITCLRVRVRVRESGQERSRPMPPAAAEPVGSPAGFAVRAIAIETYLSAALGGAVLGLIAAAILFIGRW